MTYLDWAATAPPDPDVIALMAEAALKYPGNPSSPYPAGKAARAALEDARERCAAVLGCRPGQLAFTSGGTESNAIVLLSRLLIREPGAVLLSGLEHPSVAETASMLGARGWKIKTLDPSSDGMLAPEKLAAALEKVPDVRLAAVMGVNNETGAVQDLEGLASALRAFEEGKYGSRGRRMLFHADLVQAAGKVPLNLSELDVDTASFSAHKFRGPRGIGLLYHRNEGFEALIRGGGQEHGVRPGTENVAGAAAMAAALERHGRPDPVTAENGRWLLEELLRMGGTIVPAARGRSSDKKWAEERFAPGIIAVSFPPVPGEVLARVLSEAGFMVSTGSACSSNKRGRLPKSLVAMGVAEPVAAGMIRVSFGPSTSRRELEGFLEALETALGALKGL